MKRLVYALLIVGACVLAMGATKWRDISFETATLGAVRTYYVQYEGLAPGASANQLWTPTYMAPFVPGEIDIIVNGSVNTQYFELTVYLCDTLSTAATTQAAATDSFTVKPTASATGTVMLEYVGPMSGQMRVTTPANFAGSAHAFR